jgi:hypothetical protein
MGDAGVMGPSESRSGLYANVENLSYFPAQNSLSVRLVVRR